MGEYVKLSMKYFAKYWPIALLAVLCLIGECLCDLSQPALLAGMINQGVATADAALVWQYAGRMLLVTALGMLMALGRATLSSNVSQRFGRDLRLGLYQKIMSLPLSDADQFETGSLITRLTNDVTQVQNFINGLMRIFLKAPILCVGGIIMAYRLSPRMASALGVVVPVVALIIFLSIKIGYPYFMKVQGELDRLNSAVREYLSGVRVVKAFNRFDYEKTRFEGSNEALTSASQSAMRVTAFFSPAIQLVVNLGLAAVIALGSRGGEDRGNVVAFISYMSQILMALSMFSNIFNQMVRALVSGRRMDAVLSAQSSMDTSSMAPVVPVKKGIAFDGVSFSYRDMQTHVLEGISFEAGMGETIGIIGATGSGKTTLINLIPRFYDANAGRVLLDGADVRDLDIHQLRERVAIVPQQSLLFTGTIADNLRWGKKNATEDELWHVLEAAQARGFVESFPEGLGTLLGQSGVNLSGGQKQRISIARALLKAPDVLILDDCTSALDVTTEAAIRQALRQHAKHTCCLMISQRITSIMGADRILVLDGGRIIGQGTHAELMRDCRVYQDIWTSQVGEVASNG